MDNKIKENSQLMSILDAMLDTKAEDVRVFHTGAESPIADWVVVCDGTNYTHVRAISDRIRSFFKDESGLIPNTEGKNERRWILLDYFDIIVHIMLPELRAYYKLEELWKDAEQFEITEENFEK